MMDEKDLNWLQSAIQLLGGFGLMKAYISPHDICHHVSYVAADFIEIMYLGVYGSVCVNVYTYARMCVCVCWMCMLEKASHATWQSVGGINLSSNLSVYLISKMERGNITKYKMV